MKLGNFSFKKMYVIYKIIIVLFCNHTTLYANQETISPTLKPAKNWTFMVYIVSNNTLHRFVQQNIAQMQQTGTNSRLNILVQVDHFKKKQVSHYLIEHGKSTELATLTTPPECISGTTANLFGFVKSCITKYPAQNYALTLWNHGSGIKDPHLWSRSMSHRGNECFYFNTKTQLYELPKNFDDLPEELCRGIAFNETGKTYLTNQDLKNTLQKISTELLGGKKLNILGMDACHMAMVEVCSQVKDHTDYLIGSQEIEPGPGWDYAKILQPLQTKNLSPQELAKQIVDSYGEKYNNHFADLTQSAMNLKNHTALEENIDSVSSLLIKLMSKDSNALQTLIKIRKNPATTHTFLDCDYIDLAHFYKSLLTQMCVRDNKPQQESLKEALAIKLEEGKALLREEVISNSAAHSTAQVGGLSIYFPQRGILSSYLQTVFAQKTTWGTFLYRYLNEYKNVRQKNFHGEK